MVWWVLSVLCVLSVWRRGPKSPRELYKGFHFRRIKVCRRFSQFIPLASFTINFSHLVSSPQSVSRQLCIFALTLKQKQGAIDRFQFLMWNDQSSPRMPGGYGGSRWRCGGRCWWWRWHIQRSEVITLCWSMMMTVSDDDDVDNSRESKRGTCHRYEGL